MKEIEILAFGIARDILGERSTKLQTNCANIGELRAELVKAYPELQKLASLSFAVHETYQDDSFDLSKNSQVAIIPPVSGG